MASTRRAGTVLRGALEHSTPQPAPAAETVRPVRPARPRPPKPVRYTLDLEPDLHRVLKQTAADWEVDGAVIMRCLLRQLRDDQALAARVQAEAWEQ